MALFRKKKDEGLKEALELEINESLIALADSTDLSEKKEILDYLRECEYTRNSLKGIRRHNTDSRNEMIGKILAAAIPAAITTGAWYSICLLGYKLELVGDEDGNTIIPSKPLQRWLTRKI